MVLVCCWALMILVRPIRTPRSGRHDDDEGGAAVYSVSDDFGPAVAVVSVFVDPCVNPLVVEVFGEIGDVVLVVAGVADEYVWFVGSCGGIHGWLVNHDGVVAPVLLILLFRSSMVSGSSCPDSGSAQRANRLDRTMSIPFALISTGSVSPCHRRVDPQPDTTFILEALVE